MIRVEEGYTNYSVKMLGYIGKSYLQIVLQPSKRPLVNIINNFVNPLYTLLVNGCFFSILLFEVDCIIIQDGDKATR